MTKETVLINELRNDPSQLYDALSSIAKSVLSGYTADKKIHLSSASRQEITHDAIARLMERISRKNNYRLTHVRAMVYAEVRHQIYEKKRVKWESTIVPLPDYLQTKPAEIRRNDRYAFAELLDDEDGRRVVLEIYFSRTFPALCRKLDAFKSRRWIYDNIGAIEAVYKYTRGMKCPERKRERQSGYPSISPLTRILTQR
jgi:hypothetical protein